MTRFFKKTFALSEQGAKDLTKATISCTASYFILMLPVILLFSLIENFIKPIVTGEDITVNIWFYLFFSLIILLLIFISTYIQYNATYVASYSESAVKRITLAEKLRKLPLSFFGKRDLSDLTTTIMTDAAGLETSFSHYIPELIGAMLVSVFVSVGMIIYNWKLGISLVWVVPVSFLIVAGTKKIQDMYGKKQKASQLALADGIQECIENVREIKANHFSDKYMESIQDKIDNEEKSAIVSELAAGLCVSSGQMILRVGIATSVVCAASLLLKNEIDLLTFLGFMIAATRIFDPLSAAYINLAATFNSFIQINRMKEIEDYPIQQGADNVNYNGFDIVFDNVSFSYNDGESVMNGVSFTAKQGEVTALVGPSGGGKSTAAKLSARFWDISKGKITVGGADISKIDPEALLRSYAIVFQDVTLFNNTIMENIRIGRMDATDAEVKAAAKAAQCDEFVSRLENGYETVVGENGSTLSGGERQRISIARAMLKNAPIVLLDEATASLDVENESHIQSALSELVKNKTVLVIAHRMRTVAGADKIVVLENGKVAEQGTPSELFKKKGIFSKMVELQTKSAVWSVK